MSRLRVVWLAALAAVLNAQIVFFPLKDVRPGLRGIGRTVFSGTNVEEFGVEILGVLDNAGPSSSSFWRAFPEDQEQTGIIQGMSGSPVYI